MRYKRLLGWLTLTAVAAASGSPAAGGEVRSSGPTNLSDVERDARAAIGAGDWTRLVTSAAAWAAVDRDDPVPLWLLDHAVKATGDSDALNALEATRSAGPTSSVGAQRLVEARLGLPGSRAGDRLVEWTREVAGEYPRSSIARLLEGDALALTGLREEARDALDDSVRLSPMSAYAHCVRGVWAAKPRDGQALLDEIWDDFFSEPLPDSRSTTHDGGAAEGIDSAMEDFSRAIQLDPDLVVTYVSRAEVHASQGDYGRAISDYNKAVGLQPNDIWLYARRASVYVQQRDYDSAISDYDRVIDTHQDGVALAFAYLARADAHTENGDYDLAIEDAGQAIALWPNNADAYYRRGNTYERIGDLERALADYDRVLSLDSTHLTARVARERLLSARRAGIRLEGAATEERLTTPRRYGWNEVGIIRGASDLKADVRTGVTSGTPEDNPMRDAWGDPGKYESFSGQRQAMVLAGIMAKDLTGTEEFIMVPGSDSDYVQFELARATDPDQLGEPVRNILRAGRVGGVAGYYAVEDANGAIAVFYPIVRTSGLQRGAPGLRVTMLAFLTNGSSVMLSNSPSTSSPGVAIRGAVRFDADKWVPFFGGIRCKGGGADMDEAGFTLLPGTLVRYGAVAAPQ